MDDTLQGGLTSSELTSLLAMSSSSSERQATASGGGVNPVYGGNAGRESLGSASIATMSSLSGGATPDLQAHQGGGPGDYRGGAEMSSQGDSGLVNRRHPQGDINAGGNADRESPTAAISHVPSFGTGFGVVQQQQPQVLGTLLGSETSSDWGSESHPLARASAPAPAQLASAALALSGGGGGGEDRAYFEPMTAERSASAGASGGGYQSRYPHHSGGEEEDVVSGSGPGQRAVGHLMPEGSLGESSSSAASVASSNVALIV